MFNGMNGHIQTPVLNHQSALQHQRWHDTYVSCWRKLGKKTRNHVLFSSGESSTWRLAAPWNRGWAPPRGCYCSWTSGGFGFLSAGAVSHVGTWTLQLQVHTVREIGPWNIALLYNLLFWQDLSLIISDFKPWRLDLCEDLLQSINVCTGWCDMLAVREARSVLVGGISSSLGSVFRSFSNLLYDF